jgi:hypothetical protein
LVAVVAHKLVSDNGKSGGAFGTPITPPPDQKIDRTRSSRR